MCRYYISRFAQSDNLFNENLTSIIECELFNENIFKGPLVPVAPEVVSNFVILTRYFLQNVWILHVILIELS